MSFLSARPTFSAASIGFALLFLFCSATLWAKTLKCPHVGGGSDKSDDRHVYTLVQDLHSYIDLTDDYKEYTSGDVEDYKNSQQVDILRNPVTPPKSLPSDPYAHYIYQEELSLKNFANSIDEESNDNLEYEQRSARTIVVGDIHGNLKGFNHFLENIHFDSKKDKIVLAGDLVAKGPHSLEVIDRAIEINAKCVRGNHDDMVIRWKGFLDSLSLQELEALENDDDFSEEWDEASAEIGADNDSEKQQLRITKTIKTKIPSDLHKKSEHYHIAKNMSKRQYHYLRNCPLILTLPRSLSYKDIPIHVVHAGIDPQRSILKQKPWVLINVRNILNDGTPSRKKSQGRGWANAFNQLHSKRSPKKQDFLVVYGHDAGRSLNIMQWSIGLDTGCVYGRELTGYVVETGQIISVPCPNAL
ncbi:hypothetical protein BGZ46_002692 [Entomortierella lignicola]|nr:hypothetical protein BGZ46_002692 [Entomortierella lignicola]